LPTPSPIRFDPALPPAPAGTTAATVFYRAGDALRAGYWSADAGVTLDLVDHFSEFCTLLDGTVRLTTAEGESSTYGRGEAFVIPKGFTGRWETLEPCRKFFVIHDTPTI